MKLNHLEERAAAYGAGALSDHELLASLLGERAAKSLMSASGGLQQLRKWSYDEILTLGCVARSKALALFALLEAGARCCEDVKDAQGPLDSPEKVYDLFKGECSALKVECFWVLCLDRKNRLIRKEKVTIGTATNTLVNPGEVLRYALIHSATAIICVHNHPSGDPTPSRKDIAVTRCLRQAAMHLGVNFVDHIIVGRKDRDPKKNGFFSFDDSKEAEREQKELRRKWLEIGRRLKENPNKQVKVRCVDGTKSHKGTVTPEGDVKQGELYRLQEVVDLGENEVGLTILEKPIFARSSGKQICWKANRFELLAELL
jgi:DNA repair protein RadC